MIKVTLDDILTMAKLAKDDLYDLNESVDRVPRIFLHWSAGHYGSYFNDYHINIDKDGSLYVSSKNLADIKAHTWHQNTGAIGIALACCYNANSNDLGEEPPTFEQIEAMAQVIAKLAIGLDIPIDFEHIRTHAEQADEDGYGPSSTCERWDLLFLSNDDKRPFGGDILRGKANFYREQFENGSHISG